MPADKMIDPNMAARAYGQMSQIGARRVQGGAEDQVSFADIMRQNLGNSMDTMKEGERLSARAVTGQADITDVVMAVNAADMTLKTVVAIRDRLISAYQEILRMPM